MGYPNFQHHPDGFIYVRKAKTEIYQDTITNFQTDYGSVYQGLPDGYIGRYYEPEVSHYLTTGNISVPQSLPWPEGERYIAAYQQLVANQNIRRQLK
jgi:hypothetical protein